MTGGRGSPIARAPPGRRELGELIPPQAHAHSAHPVPPESATARGGSAATARGIAAGVGYRPELAGAELVYDFASGEPGAHRHR